MTSASFKLGTTPLRPGITLLEASAGTGKTYAIAGLYLRLLLEVGLDVSQILVVTFTEAATAELRGRIRDRLADARRILREGATTDAVWQTLLLNGSEVVRVERLRRVETALEQFDTAAVYTIHGFCQRVLKQCAFETGALFDAELQPDVSAWVREAADNFWRRNFYEAPARHVLFARHGDISADSLARLLARHLQQAEPKLLEVAGGRDVAAVLADADAAFEAAAGEWARARPEIVALFGDAGGGWGKSPYNSSDAMGPRFDALDTLFQGQGTVEGLAVVGEFTPVSLAAGVSKKATRPVPSHRFFELCQTLVERLEPVAATLRHAVLSSAPTELMRIKDRDRTLGFDDLLRQVAEALRGPRGDALARGLQQRYRAALIDEFQDTDPLQWSIFQRAFTGPQTHLYLVGDPKQAIYSFRGADVFAYLGARTRADRRFSLEENWRSSRALVGAGNRLFGDHPSPFALPGIKYHEVTAAGRADATPLDTSGDAGEPLRFWFWDPEVEKLTNEPARTARLAAATAEEIVRLLSTGTRLGGRPLAPGDLAVLVDQHDQAAAVAEALAKRRVPCVRQTQESVFATREAEDLQMLLDALSDGAGDAQRRAALLTVLVHVGAEELAAQREGADEHGAAWDHWRERLARWRDRWIRDGVLAMLETVLRTQNTRSRLLATAEGERRLTNYLHLGELLQQASTVQRLPPHALAGWLSEQRARAASESKGAEETLLRLERDAAAVQLVTIHRSKGLEYPVVFCPFPGRPVDQGLKRGGPGGCDDVLFHDPKATYALCHDVGTPEFEAHRRQAVGERLAENLRLLYVALTRARHRCYVGWSAGADPGRRALSWLLCPPSEARALDLADAPEALEAWVKTRSVAELREAAGRWEGLGIAVEELPREAETLWVPADRGPDLGAAREFQGEIRRDWGPSSFSALVRGVPEEQAGQESTEAERLDPDAPEFVAGPLDAFRGTRAGICLHEILELLDFAASESAVRACVGDRLRSNGFSAETLGDPLSEWIERVLAAPLFDGRTPRETPQSDCWREMEFLLPLRAISPARLAAAFAAGPPGALGTALAPSLSRLVFPEVRGVLGGFIDLVCRSGDRWWLVDWKSNWLGSSAESYSAGALSREMNAQHYGLQYHLYVLALHRLLKTRIPDYDYERDFGGVRYVFVRGVTPGRPDLGVFADRPPLALIEALESGLLEATP